MMSLRKFALLSAITACAAFAPGHIVPPAFRRAVLPPRPLFEPPRMGFEDALATMIDNVSLHFSGQTKEAAQPPTAAEIEEYCRDPESTGCSLDDITALMAEAEKLKAASTPEKEVRWSSEIDAAVAKAD